MLLAAAAVIMPTLISLAANPATGQNHWPGALDLVRRYPWWSFWLFVLLGMGVVLLERRAEREPVSSSDPPPPPAPVLDDWLVPREEARAAAQAVIARDSRTVGLTTALQGAGGFGKTRLAVAVCADRRVRRHFRGRVYTVTIGRDVRGPAAIAAKVTEAIHLITGRTEAFTEPERAGERLGSVLAQRPRTLLVLDDVWESDQLAPFRLGGLNCVRLVTTRHPSLLNRRGDRLVHVDAMTTSQARTVLLQDLDSPHQQLPESVVLLLLEATGRWPLLMRLVNRLILAETTTGVPGPVAAETVLQRLHDYGPAAVDSSTAAALDVGVPAQREKAVQATIEAAVGLLSANGAQRYQELGIFAEDEAVPVSLVCLLWRLSGSLTEHESRGLLRSMADLSLITLDAASAGRRFTIHDVYRDYLRAQLGPVGIGTANALFVDAVAPSLPPAAALAGSGPDRAWWEVEDGYLLDHAIEHLLIARHTTEAEALACDIRWVEARLNQRDANAPRADLLQIPTRQAAEMAADLERIAHLLQPTTPDHARTSILHSRLQGLPAWQGQIIAHTSAVSPVPVLRNAWPLPDLPNPALRRILAGHTSPAQGIAIARDGTWLASTGDDGTARIWDAASGTCIRTLAGHSGPVNGIAIAHDGTWLASTGDDGTARIWDAASGACIRTLAGHTGAVNGIAIARDGTWLASTGDDGTARIWDAASGACIRTLAGHTGAVNGIAIARDGTWLATASDDRAILIWDATNGIWIRTLAGHTGAVNGIAIARDGTWLASTGDDGTARIWDAASGACIRTLAGHTGAVNGIAIARDGTWLASTGDDRTVRIWDAASGTCTRTLAGHTGAVNGIAIARDGARLATTSNDRTIRIWDASTGSASPAPVAHAVAVRTMSVSRDGALLVTLGYDNSIQIWDAASGTCTHTLAGHTGAVSGIAIAPNGTWLATTTSTSGIVQLWDLASGTRTHALAGPAGPASDVRIAPDSTWLTTATGGNVQIWDAVSGACIHTLDGSYVGLSDVRIAPDGTWLAVISNGIRVQIWDPASGTRTQTLEPRPSGVWSNLREVFGLSSFMLGEVEIAPDSTWLTTRVIGADIQTWDAGSGTCVRTLRPNRRLGVEGGTVIAPDGALLTVADHGAVRFWDAANGTRTLIWASHESNSAVTTPDGAYLATISRDGIVHIRETNTGSVVTSMQVDGDLSECTWVPGSRSLALRGAAGIYLFDFHPGPPGPAGAGNPGRRRWPRRARSRGGRRP